MVAEKLTMTFDPHTIEHLGIKMYSFLPNAIAELIANAYDADASEVKISLQDDGGEKSITVSDDGCGMSFDDINEKFLCIGRKRRTDDGEYSPSGKRKITGRKGLGKLAFFGIGDSIEISTIKDHHQTVFTLCWTDILSSGKEYEPKFEVYDVEQEHGTTIKLYNLKRKSSFDKTGLCSSLSKLFNFTDSSFAICVTLNNDEPTLINRELRLDGLQYEIEWNIPKDLTNKDFCNEKNIFGRIIAAEKPLNTELRGITLFARGRMVNSPSFFGVGESSHGYSYLTGWIDVDYVDEQSEDIISTDRQSLNWDLPITEELRVHLQAWMRYIERDWREKRKEKRKQQLGSKANIDVNKWLSVVPEKVKTGVESIIDSVTSNSELDSDKQAGIVSYLHDLLPEYTYYHYRMLDDTLKDASEEDYKRKDYYRAIEEAIKRYNSETQTKSGLTAFSGTDLMHHAFGSGYKLSVIGNYKKTNGSEFADDTKKSVQEGQHYLSAGITGSARNPIAHEEIKELQESGLLTEIDCLDLLSLLSHLFRRLKNAVKV